MKNNLKLKDRRVELGLTQEEVARQLGIDRSTYTKLENGDRNATLKMALKIVSVLKLDIKSLSEITEYVKY
jgi:DNA-binding XRE family transcriptional regulator